MANKVSAMFAELPVGLPDPVERLHAVSIQLANLKESRQAVAGEALTSLSGFAPPALLALGARIATKAAQRNVNTVTTNVPGPQIPLYVLGRKMLSAYPYVPLAGQIRIGVAIFSYDGRLRHDGRHRGVVPGDRGGVGRPACGSRLTPSVERLRAG
jgi:hypothetical protein